MSKPGLGFSVSIRIPRPTPEQRAFARQTIASRLKILGSDGTTFRPGSLLYIAMNAALCAGNSRLESEERINVTATLQAACQEVHNGVRQGLSVYHLADTLFYDIFLGKIQEEDKRFNAHGGAVHAAFHAFYAVLNQDADWINHETSTVFRAFGPSITQSDEWNAFMEQSR